MHAYNICKCCEVVDTCTQEPKNNISPYKEPATFHANEIRIRYDSMPVAHLAIAWPTCGWNDSDSIALQVIQGIIGNYDRNLMHSLASHHSSPLIQLCADQDKVASMHTFNTQYS